MVMMRWGGVMVMMRWGGGDEMVMMVKVLVWYSWW